MRPGRAREDAHDERMRSTGPNAHAAEIPASFRSARELVMYHGGHLGAVQMATVRRLNTVPTPKARRAMRAALRASTAPMEPVSAIVQVLDDFGIQPAERVQPLPPIALDDVRLVAWMAVEGTKAATG